MEKTARDLGWAALLDAIADGCAGPLGGARVRALVPATSIAEARERMDLTADAVAAYDQAESIPVRDIPAIDATLTRLSKEGDASGEELWALGQVLDAARELRAFASSQREPRPRLADALTSPSDLEKLREALLRSLERDGRVADAASTVLADARRSARNERQALRDKLGKLASKHSDVLRDGGYVERDGRFGLPVRADAHRKVDGIVLGASASGATLFVEPPAITAMSNRLKLAEAAAEREEARVLAALSAQAGEKLEAIAIAYEACQVGDVLRGMCKWSSRARARPVPLRDEAELRLDRARHPLLVAQGAEVVANDLAITSGGALVVSGPNAGGKTVALKCFGLTAWMARCGIPLTVGDESFVGFFSRVLTDIGDAQSIERSLSSFSGQVENLASILEEADHQTLVLLDEVAGGTDPEEGSALAGAVLEALVERGAAVVTTTHYERLKELAAEKDGFDNASVGFDFDAMAPTFTLTTGVPGPSSALAVASRHGLGRPILDRAKAMLSDHARDRERLLGQLADERSRLDRARREAEADASEAARLKEDLEAQRRDVRSKERNKLAREHSALIAEVRAARAKLEAAEKALADATSKQAMAGAKRGVNEAAKVVAAGQPLDRATRRATPGAPATKTTLTVGTRVHVKKLGTDGVVKELLDGGEVRVQAGAFNLTVKHDGLTVVGSAPKQANKPSRKNRKRKKKAAEPVRGERELRTSDNTCSLRGMRVHEALERLDVFVDDCLRRGERVGFALHGHGTGVLREAVREHLAAHAWVSDRRPARTDEGGDAFTVFWLKS